jgi:UDP-glucose 4-epimerase
VKQLQAWKDRRVAITGGAGFIGSTLARTLCDAGASVTTLDAYDLLGGAHSANLAGYEGRLDIRRGDVRDRETIHTVVQNADVLFNLAAQTSHQDSMTDPLTDLDINCRAQVGILEACRDVSPNVRIVFGSTRQVYGKAHYLPVDEKHPVNPPDVNAINKLAGEQYYQLYGRIHGIRCNIARLTNTYGPRMRIRDARQMFLGFWLGKALQNEQFEVWGGDQTRDMCYVDDAVHALIAMADTESFGHIFNVGGGTPISLNDLAARLVASCGSGRYVKRDFPEERRRIDIGDFYADDRLLQASTGWKRRVGLEEGLAKTVAYFRDRLDQYL